MPVDSGQGWMYSTALVDLLAEYRRRFSWLFSGLERSMDSESRGLSIADLLPGAEPGERAAKVRGCVFGCFVCARLLLLVFFFWCCCARA